MTSTIIPNNSNTQLYSFLFLGFIVSFFYPFNLIYVFLLTRAYYKDSTNIGKSLYEEIIIQFKNIIILVNMAISKYNNHPTNISDKSQNDESLVENESLVEKSDKIQESTLKKRHVSSNADSDEDIDSI
jgi:hypothetical protein